MPALKGAEIMRAYSVDFDVLPPWLQRLVSADKAGPWCMECGWSMPQSLRDAGYFTHPCCGPLELPDTSAANGERPPMTARERGRAAALRQKGNRS